MEDKKKMRKEGRKYVLSSYISLLTDLFAKYAYILKLTTFDNVTGDITDENCFNISEVFL